MILETMKAHLRRRVDELLALDDEALLRECLPLLALVKDHPKVDGLWTRVKAEGITDVERVNIVSDLRAVLEGLRNELGEGR